MADSEGTSATKEIGQSGPVGFAKLAGSSIAGRDAAAWVTDFLNAAYHRRPVVERDVDDLRFAFAVLTTYWYRNNPSRRLRLKERDDYDPSHRMKLARLGELTAESAPPDEQIWHTYEPVEMPPAEGVIAAVTRPETWPDYATEIGRLKPLRAGGLAGQTFEIEVAANARSALPVFTRGYVTITTLVTPDDPRALHDWFDLTTHRGHCMGSGHNRLVLYTLDGIAYLRAAGTWDPMPRHLDKAYKAAGSEAQHAFWGQGEDPSLSMLHQIAVQTAR